MSEVVAILCVLMWLYLIVGRGAFWLCRVRDRDRPAPDPQQWPAVVAVVPARNEADHIAASVSSLLRQDYAGPLSIVVIDDDSSDGTAGVARRAAASVPDRQLIVVNSASPPLGWTGKLWAVKQGIAAADELQPEYLLITDADIVHAPDTLAWLVKQARAGRFVLTSLMAKLRCVSFAERTHVPAFIYFFQMLFPFAWVCKPRLQHCSGGRAAACLYARIALASVGGIASIRNALIDDCSLAAKLKATGPIWLGLTDRVQSIRPYDTLSDVKRMISRSAYAQLRYSPLLLAATTAMMALAFIAPPLLAIFATGLSRVLGMVAWLAMIISFIPTLRFYGRSALLELLPCRELPGCTSITQSFPRMTICAGGVVSGRGAFTLMRRACNDSQWRTAIR